ncbi:hypothetical protein D9619_000565 [Psilocybe cf. subviscida]|uniref:Hepatocellular carcinoma-associated antigen 59-domain-containing protein n=1 Tax=Psilocybe cf. subviscida TaxID=2480587 RepID=A0A8H5BET6_9AGAR|nr:hypothetical protein D9619_000565 [Psilocybe cf. subviscida]
MDSVPIIKKRTRPQARVREISVERAEGTEEQPENEEDANIPIADLLELRKLRKAREGIDVSKLNKGNPKKKKKRPREEEGGLKNDMPEDEDDEEAKEAKIRGVIRSNNFTQQTNVLDVDKHMMAYIEENLQVRSKPKEDSDDEDKAPLDPQEALYNIADRWKVEKQKPTTDVGSVSNSLTMLTAIPEVDLGMDARLKNIEDTEKAKRVVAEERHERKRPNNDEEHLVATRFYRPTTRAKSDADILRDAKLEAMGMPPQDDAPHRSTNHSERNQMATDEMVMERFKKRLRK